MSLTDAQWARIEPLSSDTPKRDGRWRDHRQVIDAIAPWMDLPEHFGSWKGAHNRLRKWAADGTRRRSSPLRSPRPMRKVTSTWSSRSTRPSPASTSTPPGPVKGSRPASRTTGSSAGPAAGRPPRSTSPRTAAAARGL
ncbi:transposase [Streptomyces sp. R-07]|uniref:transposase n=1 Tax=Streptomyces sp. R-07 TaxID=3404052 RepID=UPI003CF7BCC6